MEAEYWYRCNRCGYMYTPQQVLALIQLQISRSGEPEAAPPPDLTQPPPLIQCRKSGCEGAVIRTDTVFREGR